MLDAPRHTARQIAELEAKLDWAQQIVKAQTETSSGVACAEERAAGNGGCGACSWCCSQWRERAEVATAELARVKAESLRVVPDGGACAAGDARGNHTFIMRGGDVFMSEPHLWDWVRIDGTYAELNDDIFVQPIRLERWEKKA